MVNKKFHSIECQGYESCEIQLMSMEFLAYPWIENFFSDKTEKYKYKHILFSYIYSNGE